MSLEELIRYKNMPIENIDRKIVPDIEDIKGKKNIAPLSMYFMKVYSGSVVKTKILDFYNELIWWIGNRV